jgi:hypothetical protein
MSFSAGFIKIAAPSWFYELHKSISKNPIKAHSKKGLAGLLKRRGIR